MATIPSAADVILVQFHIEKHGEVWWTATVEEINVMRPQRKVLAAATLMYHAEFGYGKERGRVQFLTSEVLRTEGAGPPATWQTTHWCAQGENDQEHAAAKEDEIVQGQGKRKRSKRQAGPSQATMSDMQRRLVAVERDFKIFRQCDHADLIAERVNAMRVTLKVFAMDVLHKPIRPRRTGKPSPFGRTMLRDVIEVTATCDLDMFRYVATDLCTKVCDVIYLPNFHATQYALHDTEEISIVFPDCGRMMTWLGVRDRSFLKALLLRTATEKDGVTTRVLGGLQYSDSDPDRMLHVFVGKSCMKEPPSNDAVPAYNSAEKEGTCQTVSMETSQWDVVSESFVSPMKTGNGIQGMKLLTDDNAAAFDNFSLTWNRFPGSSRRSPMATLANSESVRVGTLTLNMPAVILRSTEFGRIVSTVLNRTFDK